MAEIDETLRYRFGPGTPAAHGSIASNEFATQLANRASCRRFRADPVEPGLVRTLCSLALCAPTKSDLQQRDIIIVENSDVRSQLMEIIPGNSWMKDAPAYLVFCANNRRQRQLHKWHGHDFANDHLDAFFNASIDAGIALATFVSVAEAAGLGCCPVSAIRNVAAEVSALLKLPDHVFPIAGLGLGWPKETPEISPRLPLTATVHTDCYSEEGLRDAIEHYDRRRAALQPFTSQRHVETFGEADFYGWSEDKARQYSRPDRENFGDFIRAKGFNLA